MGYLRVSKIFNLSRNGSKFSIKRSDNFPIKKGEIVELDIANWPSGTRFDAVESLRFDMQGTDVMKYPEPLVYTCHKITKNWGANRIHTGGNMESYSLHKE